MGARVRGVAVVGVLLLVGAFLGSTLSQWWQDRPPQGGGAAGAAGAVAAPAERVRVEVLNGGGRSGMARAATEVLRDAGFDVVYFGNAARFDHDSSAVLDRTGRPDFARAVAGALGIGRVRAEPDSNLYLDVTVVLGEAWAPEAAPGLRSRGDSTRAWWDIRRFFPRADSAGFQPERMVDPPDGRDDDEEGEEPGSSGG